MADISSDCKKSSLKEATQHPASTFKGLAIGELTRLAITYSEIDTFKIHAEFFLSHLIRTEYNAMQFLQIFRKFNYHNVGKVQLLSVCKRKHREQALTLHMPYRGGQPSHIQLNFRKLRAYSVQSVSRPSDFWFVGRDLQTCFSTCTVQIVLHGTILT